MIFGRQWLVEAGIEVVQFVLFCVVCFVPELVIQLSKDHSWHGIAKSYGQTLAIGLQTLVRSSLKMATTPLRVHNPNSSCIGDFPY